MLRWMTMTVRALSVSMARAKGAARSARGASVGLTTEE